MKKIFFLLTVVLFISSGDCFAAKRYWVGGTSNSWKNKANWSNTSGTGSNFSVPGSSDTAYFDSGGNIACTLDSLVNVRRFQIASSFTQTITQSTNTVTIGVGGAVLSGGTFAGGSANITLSGVFTLSGCAFTSTSGTFSTNSNWTCSSGSFTHNSGKLSVAASMTLTSSVTGGITFHDVVFVPTAANSTYTITSTTAINVTGTLSIAGTKTSNFNTGTINIQGNLTTASGSAAGGGGTATFNFNGSGAQSLTGNSTNGIGRLPNVIVNKSADSLSLYSIINCHGNWTATTNNVKPGTSVVVFTTTTSTISGGPTFASLWLSAGGTYTIASGTVTVKGTLGWGGGAAACPVINTGTLHAKGNIDMSFNTQSSGTGGTGTIVINGTGNQTLTGSVSGSGRMCNVEINKSSGTLTLTDNILAMENWTYTAGTINAGTSTVGFSGSKTISGTHTLSNITFGAGTHGFSGDTLTASGTTTISGTGAVLLNSGWIFAKGDISVLNTATSGGGDATIEINGTGTQTLTGSGTAGAGRLPHVTVNKTSGTLTLSSIISVNGNWVYTQGTVSSGTSTVALYGNFNLDGRSSVTPYPTMQFYRVQVGTGTRTLTGDVYCNENFAFTTGTTVTASTYDITVKGNWNGQGTWSHGNDTINFIGSSFNKIQGPGGGTVNFAHVTFDRRGGSVTCVNPVTIDSSMVLAMGRIKTTTTNYLQFGDNAKCFVTNDDSAYVHGPVRKVGDDAFTFPLGDTTLHDSVAYHPLGISAPSSTSDRFQAIYLATVQTQGSTIVDSLVDLSTCEHWSLERQVGSSNVKATLSWNGNSCNTDVYGNLRVANWNSTQWADLGATAITIDGGRGTVAGSANAIFVSNIAYLTTAVAKNNFPCAVLKKKLDGGYYQAINGRLFFRFDEEYAESGDLLFNIYDDEHNLVSTTSMLPSALQPQVVYGDNRYHLNTVGCDITPSGALANGFYVLEVINDKNEKWYLRFEQDANIIISNCPPPSETE